MESVINDINNTNPLPLVSVIVTTYRRDELLKRALLSVGGQSYGNIEIIVVNDNQDEQWDRKVENIIESVKADIPFPIKYRKTEPGKPGVAAARNLGTQAAEGEYITFLDDDDIYLEDKVKRQMEDMLSTNADYGLTDLYLYNDKDKLVDKRIHSYIKSTDQESLLRYHLMYHLTGTDTLMFKAEYLERIGSFPNIGIGDEYYLMMRAINEGGRICYSPHCCVKAYVHTGEHAGLSSGYGKIEGEKNLYEEKKNFFDRLSKKEIRYVKVRHYAVLAYANLRMDKHLAFFINSSKAILISPAVVIDIIRRHR